MGVKNNLCIMRNVLPYKSPDVTEFMSVQFPEPAGKIISDSYVVSIESEITKGHMD